MGLGSVKVFWGGWGGQMCLVIIVFGHGPRSRVFTQMCLVIIVLGRAGSRLFVQPWLAGTRGLVRFWGPFMPGTAGPRHHLSAPGSFDLCVTKYRVPGPTLWGVSEREIGVDEIERSVVVLKFEVLLLSMALVAFPVCNRERRGKYENKKRYFSSATCRHA